jgi:hypothetical protein
MELTLSQKEIMIEQNTELALKLLEDVDESRKTNIVMAFARYCCKSQFSHMKFENITNECTTHNVNERYKTINSKVPNKKMIIASKRLTATQQLMHDLINGTTIVNLSDLILWYNEFERMMTELSKEVIAEELKDKVISIYRKYYNYPKSKSGAEITDFIKSANENFAREYLKINDTVTLNSQKKKFDMEFYKLHSLVDNLKCLLSLRFVEKEIMVNQCESALFCCRNDCFDCHQYGAKCNFS